MGNKEPLVITDKAIAEVRAVRDFQEKQAEREAAHEPVPCEHERVYVRVGHGYAVVSGGNPIRVVLLDADTSPVVRISNRAGESCEIPSRDAVHVATCILTVAGHGHGAYRDRPMQMLTPGVRDNAIRVLLLDPGPSAVVRIQDLEMPIGAAVDVATAILMVSGFGQGGRR